MNPKHTIHELDRLLAEIRQYRDTSPLYYNDMMNHIHNMCIRTLLEFTGKRGSNPKATIDQMALLLHIFRSTSKVVNE